MEAQGGKGCPSQGQVRIHLGGSLYHELVLDAWAGRAPSIDQQEATLVALCSLELG